MPDRLAHIEAIVHEAMLADPARRGEVLEHACGGDRALRQEVESLLAYERHASDFLAKPAVRHAPSAPVDDPARLVDDPNLQRIVGSYQLIERIGSGGMGHVYRAVRRGSEFEQTVAVKLVRREWMLDAAEPHHDTGSNPQRGDIDHRFRLERRILARLNHPNIARLIDGGSTDDGSPFIVMEQVRGERIDRYCDRRRLSIHQRIELFRTVCDAVQYAHRNLVVHRDLKPSNILVADDDADAHMPVVKLLDFGIAKVLHPDGGEDASEATDHTRAGAARLTPAYASPEQVRAKAITTASDVYSLGVILYELLCGRKPYAFGSGSAVDMERAICDTPPTGLWVAASTGVASEGGDTASARLPDALAPDAASDSLNDICAARSTDASRLRRALSGDLEKIVLMALRKEPERRYATVEALSEDLQRYLDDRPISAQPDSWTYRTRKFIERNRPATIAAGLIVAILMLATGISTLAMLNARRAQQQAEDNQRSASAVASYLKDMLASIDPVAAAGRDVLLLREMLDQASVRLQTPQAVTLAPREAAELHEAVGGAYHSIGEYQHAADHLQRAIDLRTQHEGDSLPLAAAWHALGTACYELSRRDEAEAAMLDALAIRRRLLEPDDPVIGATLAMQGNIVSSIGEHERGEILLREGIDMLRPAAMVEQAAAADADADAAANDASLHLAMALRWLGDLLCDRRRPLEGEPLLLEAREILMAIHGDEHLVIANVEAALGWCCRRIGGRVRLEAAAAHFERALKINRAFLAPDHPTMGYAHNGYASALEDLGLYEAALAQYIEAERIIRHTVGETHIEYGTVCNNVGNLYGKIGRLDEAVAPLQRAAEVYTQTRVNGADDLWVSFPLLNLARVHFRALNREEELRCAEEALRIRLLHLPEDDELVDLARVFRADGLISRGPQAFDEAERDLLAAHQRIAALRGDAHEGPMLIREALVRLYTAWNRPLDAQQWNGDE